MIQKDEEIKQLQEQLSEVEKQLECAREEAHSLREKLQKVTVHGTGREVSQSTGTGEGKERVEGECELAEEAG